LTYAHTVIATELRPMNEPNRCAMPPVKTTTNRTAMSRRPTEAVSARRIGMVFQIGRPSGTS
jgi:hypothetical protein